MLHHWWSARESKPSSCSRTGAFLSSLRLQKTTPWVWTREARELETILVFHHPLALGEQRVSGPRKRCFTPACAPPTPGVLTSCALTSASIGLYFFSSTSTSRVQHKTVTRFQARPKRSAVFLVNKQMGKLFPAQQPFAFQVPFHTVFWLLRRPLLCQMFRPTLKSL